MRNRLPIWITSSIVLTTTLLWTSPTAASTNGVVTTIYTDFGGFWNSATSNDVPTNDHNLLGFTSDGVVYSTGVNDAALSSRGINFTPTSWEALPVGLLPVSDSVIGATHPYLSVVGSTRTSPGYSGQAVSSDLTNLLTDGSQGLNLSSGLTNIPSSTQVVFQIPNGLNSFALNDTVPDILITQIAAATSTKDTLEFRDSSDNRVGNNIPIDQEVISRISRPLENGQTKPALSANLFYIQNGSTSWATNRSYDLRIKTFALSDFGLSSNQLASIKKLVWTAGGTSDVAFFAYNTSSFSAFNSSATFGTTSTTLNSISDSDLSDATVTAVATNTATPSATLSVAYSSSTTSVCTVNSSTGVVTLLTVGTCTITASQAATTVNSTSYPASSDTKSFQVLSGSGQSGSGSSSQTALTSVIAEPTTVLPKTGIEDWTLALLSFVLLVSGFVMIRWAAK